MTTRRINTVINIGGAIAGTLGSAVRSLTGAFGGVGSAIRNLEGLQRRLGDSLWRYIQQGRNVRSLTQAYLAVRNSVEALKRTQEQLNQAMARMSQNNAMRSEIQGQMSDALGLAAAMAAPVYVAANFEQSMARVGAISRATDEDMAMLTATARELGATTEWSASDAAQGMQFLAMSGFSVNEMMQTMPGLLSLATAGAVDLGQASDISAGVLRGFRLEASEMGRVGDILVNTFTTSSTSLEGLGDTMRYVAPVAASSGVSLLEAAGAAGILGNNMIRGSEAGTALRAIIARLGGPSDEAREVIERLGVETQDTAGNLRPLGDILRDFNTAVSGMGTAQRAEIMSTVFGLEAMSAATVLVDEAGTGNLQRFTASLNRVGTAAEVAAIQSDTTIGSWKELQSAIEENAIIIGNHLLPVIRDVLDDLSRLGLIVSGLANRYPNLTRAIVLGTAAIVSLRVAYLATTYAMVVFKGVMITVQLVALRLKAAFQLVALAVRLLSIALISNPIVAVVVGIAVAAGLLYVYWDPISAWFQQLWSDLQYLFFFFWEWVKETLGWDPMTLVQPTWEVVKAFFVGYWQYLTAVWGTAWNFLVTLLSWTPMGFIVARWEPVQMFFINMWEAIWETFAEKFGWITEGIQNIAGEITWMLGLSEDTGTISGVEGDVRVGPDGNPIGSAAAAITDATAPAIPAAAPTAPAVGAALPEMPDLRSMMQEQPTGGGSAPQGPGGLPAVAPAGGPQISITVNPAQGQDERSIADNVFRRVRQLLDEQEQGALYDGAAG